MGGAGGMDVSTDVGIRGTKGVDGLCRGVG